MENEIKQHLNESEKGMKLITENNPKTNFSEKQKINSELGAYLIQRTEEIINKHGMMSPEHLNYQDKISKLLDAFLVK